MSDVENNLRMILQLLRMEGTSKTMSKDALSFGVIIQARTINSSNAKKLYKQSEEYLERVMKVNYWKST